MTRLNQNNGWVPGCFLMLVLLLAPTFLHSQDATGRIVGTVTDQSDAVVPGAHVVVTNVDTHVSRETTTNGSGFYQVLALPVGTYSVSADHKGFNPITTTSSKLDINQSLKIDIKLHVGASPETVTVESNAVTVKVLERGNR